MCVLESSETLYRLPATYPQAINQISRFRVSIRNLAIEALAYETDRSTTKVHKLTDQLTVDRADKVIEVQTEVFYAVVEPTSVIESQLLRRQMIRPGSSADKGPSTL